MKLLICTQAVDKNHPILGFFHRWIEEFATHFDEVHVICLIQGVHSLPTNVHVYSLGKEDGENRLKYAVRFYKYFANIFFKVRVDYVFYHMGSIYNILGAPFFFLRSFYKTKFYWWKAHGHISKLARVALYFVDTIVTSTASGFSVNTHKRRIIGQAIDTNFFNFKNNERRTKEIIFVGRIMPVKHIEHFVDTAKLLLQDDPSLTFTIMGPENDLPYLNKLKERCLRENIQEFVKFVGPKTQQELVEVYQNASVFLNTSLTHSMDKTVLESALCGCIPVTSNKAFIDLLGDQGLYIDCATPQQYADTIRRIIDSDLASLQTLLRERIIAAHSLNTFPERVFNI